MKLELGHNHLFEIREEIHECKNTSEISILYISDLHFCRHSGPTVIRLKEAINRLGPDIIILGGDYVDSKKGFEYLSLLFAFLSTRYNVFAIAGNHDVFSGLRKIKALAEGNNVSWLENRSVQVVISGSRVQLNGKCVDERPCDTDLNVLCLHRPLDAGALGHYDLVLAGHLHGCQFVFWQNKKGLYPGKWFYRWNTLKIKTADCLYLISKGIGDTLPIRYNCKKDIIFVKVKPFLQHS